MAKKEKLNIKIEDLHADVKPVRKLGLSVQSIGGLS